MPAVSVIVPTFHRPERLRKAVASVLAQELPDGIDLEVLVSLSDPAFAPDREAAEELREDPRVRIVEAPRPGPAAARNAAMAASTGEVLAFIDDDCAAEPDWLAEGLKALTGADLVQGATRPERPLQRHDLGLEVKPGSQLWETCNLLVRRSLVDRVGPFNEDIHPGPDPRRHFGEDVEWGWRMIRAGARPAYAPDSRVLHAVEAVSREGYLRHELRLAHVAWLVRTIPEARRHYVAGRFINRHHALVALTSVILAGAATARLAGRRRPARWLTAAGVSTYLLPWSQDIGERALIDAVQVGALLAGAARWRRLVL